MLKKAMQDALNKQIQEETYSAYLYLSMAAHFEATNMPGVGSWFRVQTQEEIFHATKLFNYVIEGGGRVELQAIQAPPTEWKSALAAFKDAFKHEQHITGCIDALVDMARKKGDKATENFLQWYVAEQVEEEASVDEVVQKLELVGNDGGGLYMIDRELVSRVYNPPAAE